MKKTITSIILAVLKILIVSLFCFLLYGWSDLSKVFGSEVNYNQWVALVVIVNLFMPDPLSKSKKQDDKQGS